MMLIATSFLLRTRPPIWKLGNLNISRRALGIDYESQGNLSRDFPGLILSLLRNYIDFASSDLLIFCSLRANRDSLSVLWGHLLRLFHNFNGDYFRLRICGLDLGCLSS